MIILLLKLKDKERILKASRERLPITFKGFLIKLTADFSSEDIEARKQRDDIFADLKEKETLNQDFYIWQKYPLRMKEKLRHFQMNEN